MAKKLKKKKSGYKLNVHVSLKRRQHRADHTTFVTKEFFKAVIERAKLRSTYFKK